MKNYESHEQIIVAKWLRANNVFFTASAGGMMANDNIAKLNTEIEILDAEYWKKR